MKASKISRIIKNQNRPMKISSGGNNHIYIYIYNTLFVEIHTRGNKNSEYKLRVRYANDSVTEEKYSVQKQKEQHN